MIVLRGVNERWELYWRHNNKYSYAETVLGKKNVTKIIKISVMKNANNHNVA